MGGLALPVAGGLLAAGQSEDADAGFITKGGKTLLEAWHGSLTSSIGSRWIRSALARAHRLMGMGFTLLTARMWRVSIVTSLGTEAVRILRMLRKGMASTRAPLIAMTHSAEARINEAHPLKAIVTEAKKS